MNWTLVGNDRTKFTDALNNNRYNVAGQTYTWDAVNRVLDDFWDYKCMTFAICFCDFCCMQFSHYLYE